MGIVPLILKINVGNLRKYRKNTKNDNKND